MRNFLLLACIILLFGCQKEDNVIINADFKVDDNLLRIGEPVIMESLTRDSTLSFFWDFGDGNTSILKNPRHHYLDFGTFEIALQVSDNRGNVQVSKQTVRVGDLYVYELVVQNISEQNWLNEQNWDSDENGDGYLPDVFFELKVLGGELLRTNTIVNVDESNLPMSFQIPEVKFNIDDINFTISMFDYDSIENELIVSSSMSGNYTFDKYIKEDHLGEYKVSFDACSFTVKYKIE